jgi:outer membrane protein assembly factor BamB
MIRPWGILCPAAAALVLAISCSKQPIPTSPATRDPATAQSILSSGHFDQPGNILIADQFNNRVIEVGPTGNIIWSFGLGPNDFTDKSIIGVNDAERVGLLTLMAGTGTPPGVIPQSPGGAPDNRVMFVGPDGRIVWQYGQFGVTGSGPDQLNTPVQCTYLPNTDVLITDQGNGRIIEVDRAKKIVWQYPGPNNNPADQLNSPNSAELLADGRVLIADENNNRAIEVTRTHRVV